MNYKPFIPQVDIKPLAEKIYDYMRENGLDTIITVPIMIGAIQLTVDLLKELNFEKYNNLKHAICPIYASTYKGNMEKDHLNIKYFDCQKFTSLIAKSPNKSLILIIDDIVDTGETIKGVFDYVCRVIDANKLSDNVDIKTCSLVYKDNEILTPDFYLIYDKTGYWWVGYGMDDNEFNRITEGLYVLNE